MTRLGGFVHKTNNAGIHMFLTLHSPLPRLRLERQMLGDEDCLNAEGMSSAVTTQKRR
jgi:hypothetical protein